MPNQQNKPNLPLNKIYFIIFIIITVIILLVAIISVVADYWDYYQDLNQYDQYLQTKYSDNQEISQQINKYDPIKGDPNSSVSVYLYTDFINPQTADMLLTLKQLDTFYNSKTCSRYCYPL